MQEAMVMYDTIIIGAGPAGLMAAREIIKSTSNFIILESKEEIGLPLKCAETVRAYGFYELFGEKDHGFVMNKPSKMYFRAENAEKTINTDFIMLDRPRFEKWLSRPVAKYIQFRTLCKDIIHHDAFVEVITDKGVLKSKSVILSYGCNYEIQKKLGLAKDSPLLIPCYGGIFKYKGLKRDTLYFYYDSKEAVALWIFPKDDRIANAGVGQFPKEGKHNLRKSFHGFLKRYNISLQGNLTFAGSYPSSGPIRKTYADRIIVCGNAAGQVYGGIGEGIYFSLKAGQIAGVQIAQAIKDNDFSERNLKNYENNWKWRIGKILEAGRVFNNLLIFGIKHNMADGALKLSKREEVLDIFLSGKISTRIKLGYYLLKLTGALKKDRKGMPLVFRLLIRLLSRKA